MMRFLQINVGNSPGAQNLALQTARDVRADVIIMSEQSRNRGEEHGWFDDSSGRSTLLVRTFQSSWWDRLRTAFVGYKSLGSGFIVCIGRQRRAFLWRVLLIF